MKRHTAEAAGLPRGAVAGLMQNMYQTVTDAGGELSNVLSKT